jgi:hypothetical protein
MMAGTDLCGSVGIVLGVDDEVEGARALEQGQIRLRRRDLPGEKSFGVGVGGEDEPGYRKDISI